MKSLQGHLLVASPYLQDPNFQRGVVLLIQHTEEGAFGVVLNRPIPKTVKELWEEVGEPACDSEELLHLGGPVSGPLLALHGNAELAELEIVPGVFFSAQKDHLEKLVAGNERFRLFVGYAGWGSGQLEGELEQGAWLTIPATADYVFSADEHELWKAVARDIGQGLIQDALHIRNVPEDPSLN